MEKNIITVQHPQAEHHINGMAGTWRNWNLTELGFHQAYEIGEFLKTEVADRDFYMYVSDMNRTIQTAEEMNKTLGFCTEIRSALRGVNGGVAEEQTIEWFQKNKEQIQGYNPDYKPLKEAESDRELWDRLSAFYKEISENEKENIILISHGTAVSFLHSIIMGYAFEDMRWRRFGGSAGAVSRFHINHDGRVTASYINLLVW